MRYEIRTQDIADHKSLTAVAAKYGIKLFGHASKADALSAREELSRVSTIRVRVAGYIPD